MMKRLLCLALVAALTLSLVALTPSANAETYGQSDNTVSIAGNVAVDVTNSYLNVRSGPVQTMLWWGSCMLVTSS